MKSKQCENCSNADDKNQRCGIHYNEYGKQWYLTYEEMSKTFSCGLQNKQYKPKLIKQKKDVVEAENDVKKKENKLSDLKRDHSLKLAEREKIRHPGVVLAS